MKTLTLMCLAAFFTLFGVVSYDPYTLPDYYPIGMLLIGICIGTTAAMLEQEVERWKINRNVRRFTKEREREQRQQTAEARLRRAN